MMPIHPLCVSAILREVNPEGMEEAQGSSNGRLPWDGGMWDGFEELVRCGGLGDQLGKN